MALGGICGSLLGGYALSNLRMDEIFLIFSVLPAMQLASCHFVEDGSAVGKAFSKVPASNGTHLPIENIYKDSNFSNGKSKVGASRRKKGQKDTKNRAIKLGDLQVLDKDGSSTPSLFQSLKSASYALFKAFRQPIILR